MLRRLAVACSVASLAAMGGCPGSGTTLSVNIDGAAVALGAALATTQTSGVSDQSPCEGFFPAQANHLMTLSAATTGLTLRATADGPIVLWVRYGQSSFCSGEPASSVELTRGSWSAGDYEIFVGTRDDSATAEYVLTVE